MCEHNTVQKIDWQTRYHRFCTVPVDTLLPRIKAAFGGKLDVEGHVVNAKSSRLELFCAKPLVCCACGLIATHWAVEVDHDKVADGYKPHLNLYGMRGEDEEQFTQDHIVPRRAGGLAVLENLQVMCFSCNHNKGGA
ncbi:MAG: HNH endonuclease [Patescibacteria group bacterium]